MILEPPREFPGKVNSHKHKNLTERPSGDFKAQGLLTMVPRRRAKVSSRGVGKALGSIVEGPISDPKGTASGSTT